MTTVDPSRIETAAIEDTSLLAFYRDMNLAERRTYSGPVRPAGRSTAWIS
jgi:hypothetical protein